MNLAILRSKLCLMAKLKCKSCEKFFELNGSIDLNCPNCGEKLSNSFAEWVKKPGNEHKTFDDYKRKKCYPSHTHTTLNQPTSSHSHSDPYKHVFKANKTKKKFQKRVYIYSSVIVFLMITLFTNPNQDAHKKALHVKLYGISHIEDPSATIIGRDDLENEDWRYKSLLDGVERNILVDDLLLFSITKLNWQNKTYPIGFGMFGNVYISDQVEKFKRR